MLDQYMVVQIWAGGIGAAVTFTADTALDVLQFNVGVSTITATLGAGSPKITLSLL